MRLATIGAATLSAAAMLTTALPAQATWWVSPTGSDANAGTSPGTAFQTVNHAAAVAASGDAIHLVAGTFGDEQGNILLGTKNLVLVGAGVGATIVHAHSTLDLLLPAGSLASPTLDTHRVGIALHGTARVDIRDLTIDQGFHMPGSGRGYCLWVGGGADTVIDNVDFVNARDNPISGSQGPLGVNIRGDNAGDPTNVTMHACTVREYGKGGVVVNFNAKLTMDDCRVDGSGHALVPLAAQNAIQISRGASAEIRRTQVNDSWYEPGTVDPLTQPTATGILAFDATAFVVEDCDFGNCQAGIYAFGSVPQVVTASVRRNQIHAAQYGIIMDLVSGVDIRENSMHVALAGDVNAAFDDASPANTWADNWYSSVATAGPYAIDGGTAIDATAKPGVPTFDSRLTTTLPGGNAPLDLVLTSLDADADPDFAVLCQAATASLVIGINTGGLFATTTIPFGAGAAAATPVALVAGEFDGNPGRDLAAITQNVPPTLTENKLFVFANNGSGGFSLLHTQTLTATAPSGLAAGDVDGDGRDDLVVTDNGPFASPGSARVLRNNGTGTGFTSTLLPGAFTTACRDAAIARLDGDANRDIAIVEGNGTSGRLHLFAGNGLGGFTALGSPITTAVNANSVLATDLDGDNDNDLLVSCSRDALSLGTGEVDVLDNNGAAVFTMSQYRTERGPTAMAAGDFEQDADPDTLRRDVAIVDLVGGSVTVAGTWLSGRGFGTGGIVATGTLATGVGIGDVDGNGYPDVVWCDTAAGTVVAALGAIGSRADFYGAGCPGTSDRIPYIAPLGAPQLPTLPNPTFGLSMSNARPFSVVVFASSMAPGAITPCGLLLATVDETWFAVSSAAGNASVPLPVPGSPVFKGLSLYFQGGVFDPAAGTSFLPGLALTRAMRLRAGD